MIGQSVLRTDALAKVTGEAQYPGDIDLPGQLWMKILFSERTHARVKSIDTTQALAHPGVVAVFTAADVPFNEYGLILKDQPVLCGPGSAKAGADIVRCLMDNVALVVAETEEAAAAGRDLLIVEYEDLPSVFDPEEAMQAPLNGLPPIQAEYPDNVLCHYQIRKGDVDAAFAQCDAIVEAEYQTGYQEHAYLQPEAGLGYIDDEGRVTVLIAGQWTHEDQEQIAHALDLPMEQVRVIYPAIGGAFGGREDMSVQIVLALAAMKLRRPVKILWSREESMIGHHKRHPIKVRAKWGATKDGKILAAQAVVIGDAGPYTYTTTKVIGNATLMCTGPYDIPNAHVDSYGVLTNNIPTGAFRGFGGPQGALAAEGMVNRLADALGIDPLEIRRINCLREGRITSTQTPVPRGVSIAEVLEQTGQQSDYWRKENGHYQRIRIEQPQTPTRKRGFGIACAFKNIGFSFGFPEHCFATVELYGGAEIERAVVKHAGADVGQGAHTVIQQMAAQALNLPLEKITLVASDTATAGSSGSASASRMTFLAGNSIIGAAEAALKKWRSEERPAIAEYEYRPPKTTAFTPHTGEATPNFAYGYLAQVAEVEVDLETGLIDVVRVVSVHDVGKAINPQQVIGQIEGAVVQAHGYALMENMISVNGKILNPYLSTYLIPTVYDIPGEVKSVVLEVPDPHGPFGARGMAEMPMMAYAPAVCAAIYDATGVWIDHIPLTPDRVIQALNAANAR